VFNNFETEKEKRRYEMKIKIVLLALVLSCRIIWAKTEPEIQKLLPNEKNLYYFETTTILPERDYGSLLWGDANNDNQFDLFITGRWGSQALWINDNGSFSSNSTILPSTHYSRPFIFDYDNDNNLDYIQFGDDLLARLWRNDGTGNFTLVSDTGLIGFEDGSIDFGDYDNDGDFDLIITGRITNSSSNTPKTRIYRNEGNGAFTDINANIMNVRNGDAKWGDYDNDGDLDFLISGNSSGYTTFTPYTKMYRNDGNEIFTPVTIQVSGDEYFSTIRNCAYSSIDWGDYNNDGNLDFAIAGYFKEQYDQHSITYIYRNNGNSTFTKINANMTGLNYGSVTWGDYNCDGYLDLLVSGHIDMSDSSLDARTELYANNGNDNFLLLAENFSGVCFGNSQWGDYDNDGDMDIALVGKSFMSNYEIKVVGLYRNDIEQTNSAPTIPTGLASFHNDNQVRLSWFPSNDPQTGANGITYNFYVQNTEGKFNYTPMGNVENGFRKLMRPGNADRKTNLTLTALPNDIYSWSVQAIDNSFTGSDFAEVNYFCIGPYPADANAGTCVQFDGANDYIEIANPFASSNTDFTISLWVSPAIVMDGLFHAILGRQNTYNTRAPSLWVYEKRLHFDCCDASGNHYGGFIENVFNTINQWVQITWVKEGTESRFYRNGRLLLTAPAPTNIVGTDSGYYLGRADIYFTGKLDEIQIWNTARTEEEIKNHLHLTLSGNETGLSAYYQFNSSYPHNDFNIPGSNTANLRNGAIKVTSGISAGSGNFEEQTVDSNIFYDFTTVSLQLNVTEHTGANDLGITKLTVLPNNQPRNTTALDEQYWIIHNFSTNSVTADMHFSVYEDMTQDDEDFPELYQLYHRSVGNESWSLVTIANSISAANDVIIFADITVDGEFLICRNEEMIADDFFPECMSDGVPQDIAPVITFNQKVYPGTGSVHLYYFGDDELIETFHASQLNFNANVVTIELSEFFTPCETYYILIDEDAFLGNYGNYYPGLFSMAFWHFTVEELFSEVFSSLKQVSMSNVAWGDYDGDGDLDILLGGYSESEYIAYLYRNEGARRNSFTELDIGLPGVAFPVFAWFDYNLDDDLDILYIGGGVTTIFQNNGNDDFTNINPGFLPVTNACADISDFNNDGFPDVIISGEQSGNKIVRLYFGNELHFFSMFTPQLPAVMKGTIKSADFNNDGNLDLLVLGSSDSGQLSQVFSGDGNGNFTLETELLALAQTFADFSDYDNDGDLDILYCGFDWDSWETATVLYRNDGDFTFSQMNTRFGLEDVYSGSLLWGDYTNDGFADFLLTGDKSPYSSDGTFNVYKNNRDDTFSAMYDDYNYNPPLVYYGLSAIGDYDRDGDLDVVVTGDVADWKTYTSVLMKNNVLVSNTKPVAPDGLSAIVNTDSVLISWNSAYDAETPSNGLTYNVRIGTAPGFSDVVNPMADGTGLRKVVSRGNAGSNTFFQIKNLADNVYYYSVQAIDAGFEGSEFSVEGIVIVGDIPLTIPENVQISIQDGIVTITWNGVTGATSYKIYSSDIADGEFTEETDGVFDGLSWSKVVSDFKKFYHVKAVKSSK
jgi:hypothetical protein